MLSHRCSLHGSRLYSLQHPPFFPRSLPFHQNSCRPPSTLITGDFPPAPIVIFLHILADFSSNNFSLWNPRKETKFNFHTNKANVKPLYTHYSFARIRAKTVYNNSRLRCLTSVTSIALIKWATGVPWLVRRLAGWWLVCVKAAGILASLLSRPGPRFIPGLLSYPTHDKALCHPSWANL